MREYFGRRYGTAIVLLLISFLAVLAACSTVNELNPGKSSSEISGDTGSFESSDQVSEDSQGNAAETSTIGPEIQGGSDAADSEANTAPVRNDNTTANIDVDLESIEVDEEGITVGFTKDGHAFRGDPSAPVVIEEYSDYQCPYCSRFYSQTLPQLVTNQVADGEAVIVYYDFPLTRIHPQAIAAANAARCAGEQGATNYWLMHDSLFQNLSQWSNSNAAEKFRDYAESFELDLASFDECLSGDRYSDKISSDLNRGSSLGISGTPSFVINGELLVGAQPVEVFNAAISTVLEGGTITVSGPSKPAAQLEPAVAPTPALFAADYAASMGDPSAPVTIVEFTDYQCPYCARHSAETMPTIIEEMVNAGRVHYILKDFPLDRIHPEARLGAAAARCAGEQNNYWEMHDAVFANQQQWAGQGEAAPGLFSGYAQSLGLDEGAFLGCLESGKYDEAIEVNLEEGRSLGVSGTPHFFVDGYPLSGARPIEHFVAAVSLAEEGRLEEAFTPQEQPTPSPAEIPTSDSYAIGSPDAPVTIIEYTDYQCPYCSRHSLQTFPRIVSQYVDSGVVRYVFKDFPLTQLHPQAIQAAEAARCAGDQGSYVEMHDLLFSSQQQWSGSDPLELFVGYAEQIDLDSDLFRECLESDTHEQAVIADLQEGIALGVTGTPAFFINGYAVTGAQPFENFQQAIESLLQQIEG